MEMVLLAVCVRCTAPESHSKFVHRIFGRMEMNGGGVCLCLSMCARLKWTTFWTCSLPPSFVSWRLQPTSSPTVVMISRRRKTRNIYFFFFSFFISFGPVRELLLPVSLIRSQFSDCTHEDTKWLSRGCSRLNPIEYIIWYHVLDFILKIQLYVVCMDLTCEIELQIGPTLHTMHRCRHIRRFPSRSLIIANCFASTDLCFSSTLCVYVWRRFPAAVWLSEIICVRWVGGLIRNYSFHMTSSPSSSSWRTRNETIGSMSNVPYSGHTANMCVIQKYRTNENFERFDVSVSGNLLLVGWAASNVDAAV